MESEPQKFEFKAKEIPTDAGCYLFYDKNEKLLYVGKAKNLRKRVNSYFQKNKKSPKTSLLVKKISKIETRIVNSEMEALLLENNLIKEFRPKFNILLRDDKNFLYLRITNEVIPQIEITRRIVRDGSFYLGPKTSSKSFRKTITFCQKVFQIRDCKLKMEEVDGILKILKNPENRKIPCLDFHVKKCSGPCAGEISIEDYQRNVQNMKKFLRGETKEVLKALTEKMMDFAEKKLFEAATKIRDLIQSIKISTEKQTVQFVNYFNADFIHFHRDEKTAYFVRILFRNGRFIDQNEVAFQAPNSAQNSEILEKFLVQFYEKVDRIPSEIYLPEMIENVASMEVFLSKIGEEKELKQTVKILVPQKGDKKKILEMAEKNAKNFESKSKIQQMSQAENFAKALPNLAKILDLKEPPKRIECFDVSHFSGQCPVASQAVFINGKPKTSEYRRFHIKTLPKGKIDDFAAMNEVLERRFIRVEKDEKEAKKKQEILEKEAKIKAEEEIKELKKIEELEKETSKENPKTDKKKKKEKPKKELKKIVVESKTPDLIVLDGGKGQLSAVMKLFKESSFTLPSDWNPETKIISIAKKEELIFRPGKKEPIELDFNDPALKLIQQVRDESHRFAISFNRSLRRKEQKKSILDEVSGIGPSAKKKLMKQFETISGIRKATDDELLKIVNQKQLENLRKMI